MGLCWVLKVNIIYWSTTFTAKKSIMVDILFKFFSRRVCTEQLDKACHWWLLIPKLITHSRQSSCLAQKFDFYLAGQNQEQWSTSWCAASLQFRSMIDIFRAPRNTAAWSKVRGCSHNSFQKRACGHTSQLEWHTPGSRSRTYQGGALTKPGLVLFTSVGLRLSPSAALDDGMAGDSRPQRQRGLHPVASAAAVLPRRMFQPSRPCYPWKRASPLRNIAPAPGRRPGMAGLQPGERRWPVQSHGMLSHQRSRSSVRHRSSIRRPAASSLQSRSCVSAALSRSAAGPACPNSGPGQPGPAPPRGH